MNRRDFLFLSTIAPLVSYANISSGDIYLTQDELHTLYSLDKRLRRLRGFVGYANFNIISFDTARYYARNYSKIGKFTPNEITLVEKLFYSDPSTFGFYGDKTVDKITQKIDTKDIQKIPHSGHFIYKGKALEDYTRMLKDIGDEIILTSGIRNVVKQLSLYISKLKTFDGNLTKASRVIAPPAYSYHTISDFDIGKKGWGYRNFTADFAKTPEFTKMRQLNYVGIRYTINNKDGVRFEPWHVKVI